MKSVPTWLVALAAALPLAVFSVDLGAPSLWDPDEGRHAEIASEMLISGEWLTPTLNQEPYRERPPVYYWLLAAGLALFGHHNEAAARLPSAVFAVLGIWGAILWGWRYLRPTAGVLAGVILATSAGYVGMGRLAIVDAVYSVLIARALLAMGERLTGTPTGFPWAFYGWLAAATMVGGPVAVLLAALVAAAFVTIAGDPGRLRRLRLLPGVFFFAVLVAPLFIGVASRDPEYLGDILWRHGVLRYRSAEFPSDAPESIFFYLWITPALMLPWALFLPWSLRDALRPGGDRVAQARLFLVTWVTVFFVFFSLSATKQAADVLPALCPLALLSARSLTRLLRVPASSRRIDDPVIVAGMVLFGALLVLPLVGRRILENEFPTYTDRAVFLLLLIPLAAAGLPALVRRSRPAVIGWIAVSAATFFIGLYHFGGPTVSAYNSMEIPAQMIGAHLPPTASLVSYRTTSHSLAFYSRRPVWDIDDLEPAVPLLNADAPAALITKERYLPVLRAVLRRSLYIWWNGDSKKVLLANRPPPPGADQRILLPLAANLEEGVTPAVGPGSDR